MEVAADLVVEAASEEVFEAAAAVLEVVLEVAAAHLVDLLVELGREEQHQIVEVGHIPIVIIILDDTTIGDRGTGVGGTHHGGVITTVRGIIHLYMLEGEQFLQ